MRYLLVALSLLIFPITSARAQVSVGIELPGVDIGINMPVYPDMVQVPGYPVYYAPGANSNYFFYDGLYWVFSGDSWYVSSWYNGPWQTIGQDDVPLFVLRVPVRYYRRPPVYFQGWRSDRSPRWGKHWGPGWSQRHRGWSRWDHRSAPRAAPLPVYQRHYQGDRYPRAVKQQHAIRHQKYRYQPREAVTQRRFQRPAVKHNEPRQPRPGRNQSVTSPKHHQPAHQPQHARTQQVRHPQPAQRERSREKKPATRGRNHKDDNDKRGHGRR